MFGKNKKQADIPPKPVRPKVRMVVMPEAFYGGKDPSIYHDASASAGGATHRGFSPTALPPPPAAKPPAQPLKKAEGAPKPPVSPTGAGVSIAQPRRSRAPHILIIVLVLLAVLLGLGWFFFFRRPSAPAPAPPAPVLPSAPVPIAPPETAPEPEIVTTT